MSFSVPEPKTTGEISLRPSLRPYAPYVEEAPPEPVLSELEIFLDRVLCDGRYVQDLDRPLYVAQKLGIEISPGALEELVKTPRAEVFRRLYRARFPKNDQLQMLSPDIGVLILAAVFVTIVIVIVVTKWRAPDDKIVDRSPHSHLKL